MELNSLPCRLEMTIIAEMRASVAHIGCSIAAKAALEVYVLFSMLVAALIPKTELLREARPASQVLPRRFANFPHLLSAFV